MRITPSQIAAAMGLITMQAKMLAQLVDLNENTLSRILKGTTKARDSTLELIKRALEAKGVEFLDNEGVRKRASDIEIFEGSDRFEDFSNFVYQHLKQNGGNVCVSVVDEGLFAKYRKDPDAQRKRIKELVDSKRVTWRVLATESKFTSSYAQFKRQPRQSAVPTSFYAFGDCLALISFDHDPAPYVILIKSGPFAEAYRQSFNTAWAAAEEPPKQKSK